MSKLTAIYPAILFDLDGTLMLSLETKVKNAGQLWHEKFSVLPDAVQIAYLRHSGIPRYELFQKIAEEVLARLITESEYIQLSDEFTRRNIKALHKQPFVDGAEELLRGLELAGVVMVITSSAEHVEVEERMKGRRESSFFCAILGSHGEFHKGRPHLEYISRLTSCQPERMLMVGDEPNDLHLARNAGVKIALVAQTRSLAELESLKPNILVSTLPELRPYLLK